MGTPATARAVPLCSVHKTPCEKNDADEWYCPTCADAWLKERVRNTLGKKTRGGVLLPTGVEDPSPAKQHPSFRDIPVNRATRRATRRHHGRQR